jgi:hypothetical protein
LQHPPGRFSSPLDATITGLHPTANPHRRVTVREGWWFGFGRGQASYRSSNHRNADRRTIRSSPCHVPVPAPEGVRGREGLALQARDGGPVYEFDYAGGGVRRAPAGTNRQLSGRIDKTAMIIPGTRAVARRGGVCHCCFRFSSLSIGVAANALGFTCAARSAVSGAIPRYLADRPVQLPRGEDQSFDMLEVWIPHGEGRSCCIAVAAIQMSFSGIGRPLARSAVLMRP